MHQFTQCLLLSPVAVYIGVVAGNCNERSDMMTSSNGNIFRIAGPLCGEFTGHGEFPSQKPVTRSFDVFVGLRLNKRSSKQSLGWWFETSSCPLWRHCNDITAWRTGQLLPIYRVWNFMINNNHASYYCNEYKSAKCHYDGMGIFTFPSWLHWSGIDRKS